MTLLKMTIVVAAVSARGGRPRAGADHSARSAAGQADDAGAGTGGTRPPRRPGRTRRRQDSRLLISRPWPRPRSRARRPRSRSRSSRRRRSARSAKNKAARIARTKLSSSAGIMNDQARLALEKEVDKLTREVQFMQQEAESERKQLRTELQVEFQRKLDPCSRRSARRRGCTCWWTSRARARVWGETGLDLTGEVIKRLDAASRPLRPRSRTAATRVQRPGLGRLAPGRWRRAT